MRVKEILTPLNNPGAPRFALLDDYMLNTGSDKDT